MDKVFRPAARLVIIKENKILLCKMGNVWGLPGGGVDWGESFPVALKRESIEELGIPAEFEKILFIQDFLVQFNDKKMNKHALEYFCTLKNNSDFFNVVDTYHNSTHAHELKDVNWFGLDNIPEEMKPFSFIPVLEKYLKNPNNIQGVYESGIH